MLLYLGIVPGLYPWLLESCIHTKMKEKNVGIMLSYWNFRKFHNKIISKGLHDFFSFDGNIMVDSGAYSAYNSGIEIKLKTYSRFLSRLDFQEKDIIVNLDVIGDPNQSKRNWQYLTKVHSIHVLPVTHIPEKEDIYNSISYLGLGGLVPSFKINQKGSAYNALTWIVQRYQAKKRRYHGFGIGSPFHQIIFRDLLYSIDWIGWRRNAAVCSCYTPEGSVYISEARKRMKKGKKMTPKLFAQYAPPFIDSIELLYEPGSRGWIYRALWNVWWFLNALDHKEKLSSSKYVRSLLKHKKSIVTQSKTILLDSFF